jgi:hypothetical protein
MITPTNKLELHYYFNDDSHSMNAQVRNECEREILAIIKEMLTSLDIEVDIESEAFTEGGLREWWKLIGKNSPQITLIIALLTVYLSRVPLENRELVQLQIENLKLDNEIKQQELKKIKNEIKTDEHVTEEVIEKVIEKLDKDYKLIWHKSNFYKKLSFYPKVEKIATRKLDQANRPIDTERTVLRNEFREFVLMSDKFPPNIDEEAVIDIISPVLKKGSFTWKGFYKGQVIGFEMKDEEFKNAVLNKQIEFVNGTAIKCVLQQNRKIDAIGMIQIVNNHVLTVLEIVEGNTITKTEQGAKYLRDKNAAENQMTLDL